MQKIQFEKGKMIFSEGEPSARCYKILSGKVEIFLNDPANPGWKQSKTIAICGTGEIVGEMGVIGNFPRSASAVAIEPTVCKCFTSDEIISLLGDEPREALAYVRTLIQRIRHTNSKVFFPSSRDG
jgi:CRP/FNR family cyclic AMP-dependent transcriptional regulator